VTAPAPRSTLTWLERLVDTPPSLSLSFGRLMLGGVMFPHACQKVFGAFGGPGFSATLDSFRQHMGIPSVLAVLVILAEFFGSIGLILGLLGRVSAACIMAVMIGAVALVHAKIGFFMNWMGTGKGEGWEYHALAIGLAAILMARGSGVCSVDRWLKDRLHPKM